MKIAVCISVLAALVGTCYRSHAPIHLAASDNLIDYPLQGDRYAVVVVRSDGMSEKKARELARQRAAEIAVEQGAFYFVIEGETQVQMIQSDEEFPSNEDFAGNLYQEQIVEKGFSKRQTSAQQPAGTKINPALRVVFKIYAEKPKGKSFEACKYTNCQK